MGVPFGIPKRSSALCMCMALRMAAISPITRLRPSPTTKNLTPSPFVRLWSIDLELGIPMCCIQTSPSRPGQLRSGGTLEMPGHDSTSYFMQRFAQSIRLLLIRGQLIDQRRSYNESGRHSAQKALTFSSEGPLYEPSLEVLV